jgi:adenylate kinase family enzyme
MQPQTYIFIGRSGAGKGTQIQLLMDTLKAATQIDVLHVEPGNSFREFINTDSYSAAKSRDLAAAGGLQPAFLSIWVWADILVNKATGKEHVLLDGMPRRMSEAKILESALKFYEVEKPTVIFLDVSEEWATERLFGRGRNDDGRDSIERRMKWFDKDVADTVEYMKGNSYYNYVHINGEQTIEQVHADIAKAIGMVM